MIQKNQVLAGTLNFRLGSTGRNNLTHHILVEDSWFYGLGGRYTLSTQNADYLVFRRVVVRHDGGWTDTKGDPEAGIAIYNTGNTILENVIVLDSNLEDYHTWYGALYHIYNSNTGTPPHHSNNNQFIGLIFLNNKRSAFVSDGTKYNGSVADSVFWDHERGMSLATGSAVVDMDITKVTLGETERGVSQWTLSSTISVNNTIFYNITDRTFEDVTQTDNLCYDAMSCTPKYSYDPLANGLMYLPRVEDSSNLSNDHLGANIVNRLGASGALYHDNGFDELTDEQLWPWPNEDRIKKVMCNDVNITRGFCTNATGLYGGNVTLTSYIWEYLGNPCPEEICNYTISEVYHDADIDQNGTIETSEIKSYVSDWKNGNVLISDLFEALSLWKSG